MRGIIERIFSDDYRWIKIVLLALTILGLSLYGYLNPPELTYQMCRSHPADYDGTRLQLAREVRVVLVGKDFFEVIQGRKERLRIKGNAGDVRPGECVSLVVRFHQDAELELLAMRVSRWRKYRIAVSVAAMLIVFFLFFRGYYFSPRKFLFLRRKNA